MCEQPSRTDGVPPPCRYQLRQDLLDQLEQARALTALRSLLKSWRDEGIVDRLAEEVLRGGMHGRASPPSAAAGGEGEDPASSGDARAGKRRRRACRGQQ